MDNNLTQSDNWGCLIIILLAIIACNTCCSSVEGNEEVDDTWDQIDSHPTDTNDRFVSDSVFIANQKYIRNLKNLNQD